MNYDTPASRFGVIGVDVIPRGNVHYLHEPLERLETPAEPDEVLAVEVETIAHDELRDIIHSIAVQDVESGDIEALLQPETAVRRALDVYDVYVSDTSFQAETAVAEYLYAFTEAVLDPVRGDVDPEAVEAIFTGFSALLRAQDLEARVSA